MSKQTKSDEKTSRPSGPARFNLETISALPVDVPIEESTEGFRQVLLASNYTRDEINCALDISRGVAGTSGGLSPEEAIAKHLPDSSIATFMPRMGRMFRDFVAVALFREDLVPTLEAWHESKQKPESTGERAPRGQATSDLEAKALGISIREKRTRLSDKKEELRKAGKLDIKRKENLSGEQRAMVYRAVIQDLCKEKVIDTKAKLNEANKYLRSIHAEANPVPDSAVKVSSKKDSSKKVSSKKASSKKASSKTPDSTTTAETPATADAS